MRQEDHLLEVEMLASQYVLLLTNIIQIYNRNQQLPTETVVNLTPTGGNDICLFPALSLSSSTVNTSQMDNEQNDWDGDGDSIEEIRKGIIHLNSPKSGRRGGKDGGRSHTIPSWK